MGEIFKLPSNGEVSYYDRDDFEATTLELDEDAKYINTHSLDLWLKNIDEVRVSASNKFFTAKDGVLYSRDLSSLLWYPPKKADEVFSIPTEVKKINEDAICGQNLKRIEGGHGLESIDTEFCSAHVLKSLQEFRIESNMFTSVNGVLFNKEKSVLIKCPVNCICDLGDSALTTIGNHSLLMNHRVWDVTLGDNIKTIGTGAFLGSDIESFVGGSGLRLIGLGAFASCKDLETVALKDGLEIIEVGAFNNCRRLKELLIPKTVFSIGFSSSYSTISKKTNILCEKGSYAERYAKKHGHTVSYI